MTYFSGYCVRLKNFAPLCTMLVSPNNNKVNMAIAVLEIPV